MSKAVQFVGGLGIPCLTAALFAMSATACGGATHSASPQPRAGTAALTGANMGAHFDRVLVAERGAIAMVSRDGCIASVGAGTDATGDYEEMRIRCPKPERLKAWFNGVDKITSSVPLEAVN